MARSLIVDCDPGVDDAIAILLTLASPEELHLLGITTVAGNVPLALTQTNARKICELAGRPDIPVFAGCPRPLLRPLETAREVHGRTGLDGAALPAPTMPLQSQHAVAFLIEAISNSPEPITIAAVGPLTNLAVAFIQAPQIVENIAEIAIMGGAISQGNVTPSAEFNFYVDPHAADVVLKSGAKIALFTLDLTHQLVTAPARLQAIRAIDSPAAIAAADMLEFYGRFSMKRYGTAGGFLHDPCPIAYLIQPQLFEGRSLSVELETLSDITRGRAIVDLWGVTGRDANAVVMERADADGIYGLLCDRLRRL
ncbi:nucleoside hydrolase [Synechococcus sp. PCC 7336]|uniref:nucleoside hydrolase n=1 Tax=Synechococcus sp. PCC 7336 TaxID=195250 RepID=UPI000349706F|nr:nucleoside hydrolase [Synechococcus sp. PCC 7336]